MKNKSVVKLPPELLVLGSFTATLDEDFLVQTIHHANLKELPEAQDLKLLDDFILYWQINYSKSLIHSELALHSKWDCVHYLTGKLLNFEFVKTGNAKAPVILAIVRSFSSPSASPHSAGNSVLPTGLPCVYWTNDSAQKESNGFFNGGVKELFGFTEKELNGLPGKYLSIIYIDDIATYIRECSEFENDTSRRVLELNYRVVRKDGQIRWVRDYITAVKDQVTRSNIYSGFICDNHTQKEHERKLVESENALREINFSKDRFINILSHDLRAPFTSILGFAEILMNENNLSTEEKSEYLSYIFEASENQLQFINYLLDWSRLRTGTMKIEPQRLKLQALVYNCVSMLTGTTIRKNIIINVDIGEKIYVQADERLLTQAILNLLSNAVKFSQEHGIIEVTSGIFNETHIEVIVRDSGIGIEPEDQAKIFSIEKTYSRDGTQGEKGSGFGLALVHEIVNKHHGEIWFYSEVNKGTEFHFTLPAPSNTIVVIINDDKERASVIDAIGSSFPEFTVMTAENGYEALTMVSQYVPNAIIAEHNMPLMTGQQLIEAIKKGDADLKVPVLIIAGSLTDDEEQAYYQLGAKSVFKRPIVTAEFVTALKLVLN